MLASLQVRYPKSEVGLYLISSEPRDQSLRYLRSQSIALNALTDGTDSVRRSLGIAAIPTAIVLDGSGSVRAVITGIRPVELENALDAVLGRTKRR